MSIQDIVQTAFQTQRLTSWQERQIQTRLMCLHYNEIDLQALSALTDAMLTGHVKSMSVAS